MRTADTIKDEIKQRLGFLPSFFAPAFCAPDILENIWQQTISAYLDNMLPALFKEKLLVCLGRSCRVPYFVVFHSCALRSLGITGSQVLALLESPLPTETACPTNLALNPPRAGLWPRARFTKTVYAASIHGPPRLKFLSVLRRSFRNQLKTQWMFCRHCGGTDG